MTPTEQARTLVDILAQRAAHETDRVAYTFSHNDGSAEESLTYGELYRTVRAIAARLERRATEAERAMLLYPPGLNFVCAFFACLVARVIAIPAYPPSGGRSRREIDHIRAMISDAQPTMVLSTSSLLTQLRPIFAEYQDLSSLPHLATDRGNDDPPASYRPQPPAEAAIAFLQYTSGSTADPKGVMVSQANLLHNLRLICDAFGHHAGSRGVIWLPPYHDMGLIGGILQPLYAGFPVTLMPPSTFLRQPSSWLDTVSRCQATTSGGPSFAYEFCLKRIPPERRSGLDLRSWQVAFNGAEPIRPDVISRFSRAFAPCGFNPGAFYPCYGLAEATLIVSGGSHEIGAPCRWFDAEALFRGTAVPVDERAAHARPLASSGSVLGDQRVIVVDPVTQTPCLPGRIGEIWLQGPSVAQGYWGRSEQTDLVFHARLAGSPESSFLRTGDLGFLHENKLVISGRLKEIIIVRGRNYFPQDLEPTVEHCHHALRPASCAVFTVPGADGEELVVMAELDRVALDTDHPSVIRAVRQAIALEHGLHAHTVLLVRPGTVAKTTSGKIRRHACRAAVLDGTISPLAHDSREESPVHAGEPVDRTFLRACPEELRLDLVERRVRTMAAACIGVAPSAIDPYAELSTLGLDSLMAAQLEHELESVFGVHIDAATLLGELSASDLISDVLDSFSSGGDGAPAPLARQPRPRGAATGPLSVAQEQMWILDQLVPGSVAYTVPLALRLRGKLCPRLLDHTLTTIVQRHGALRTHIRVVDDKPVQWIYEETNVPIVEIDVRGLPESLRPSTSERLIAEEVRRPFNLTRGPLLRCMLLRLADTEHILVLMVHHIIVDGSSLAIVMREFSAIYNGALAGRAPTLPDVGPQYVDVAAWERQQLAAGAMASDLSYWEGRLTAVSGLELSLPARRGCASAPTLRGAMYPFTIDADHLSSCKRLSRESGATLYMLLLAAFHVLLARYAQQDVISVGCPIARRDQHVRNTVGCFLNTLVLPADVSSDPSFLTFLADVRRSALGAYAHAAVPFGSLVERFLNHRDARINPYFQAIFVFESAALSDLPLTDLSVEPLLVDNGTAKAHVTLSLTEEQGRLTGFFQYSTELFDHDLIEHMAGSFRSLLRGIVTDPARRVSSLPLLSEEEAGELLPAGQEATVERGNQRCVHTVIEEQVAATPDAVAVVYEDQQVTYGELNRRADALARYLRLLGIGPEKVVGICLERSVDFVVAVLAVLKSGGAYVPLDPAYPSARLAAFIARARPPVVLAHSHVLDRLVDQSAPVICLDTDWPLVDGAPVADTVRGGQATPDCLAFILFTSGSTGEPKGVAAEHRHLMGYVVSILPRMNPQPPVHYGFISSISTDIGITCLFPPLCTGQCLHVISRDRALSSTGMAQYVEERSISVLKMAPSHFFSLRVPAPNSYPLPAQWLILGGEPLTIALVRDIESADHRCRLMNHYGPSETICGVLTYQVCADSLAPDVSIMPLGYPLGDARVYILDRHLQPAPRRVTAELVVGGPSVSRGYHGRPALTAERFVPDPFGGPAGSRMYRSGDRGRRRPEGTIEILGRIDDQIKVHGYRVEPAEITACLTRHAAIAEAVVIAREIPVRGRVPIAYVVPDGSETLSVPDLRRYLQAELPSYMVPPVIIPLERLPLLPNGKVDRDRLPLPPTEPVDEAPRHAPTTDLEMAIAAAWEEVLGVARPGIHDGFFDLGGNSLLLIRLQGVLKRTIGVDIPAVDLFTYPTIAQLAAQLADVPSAANGRKDRVVAAEAVAAGRARSQSLLARQRSTRGPR